MNTAPEDATAENPLPVAWRIHHATETVSTNLDARAGRHGDVYCADFQTAGRGRLDHRWLSPPGANLMMSVVLSVDGLDPARVSTLPLVVGLAVVRALKPVLPGAEVELKWPNDVFVDGRKISGILCERQGDAVIAGIGVNVRQSSFPPEIAARATSLALCGAQASSVAAVRDAVLVEIAALYALWRESGFAAVHPSVVAVDFLKGRSVAVRQTDDDAAPVVGVANGICADGALDVGGVRIYAGEVSQYQKLRESRPVVGKTGDVP